MINVSGRHPATQQIARWFDSAHLPEDLRLVSAECEDLAAAMIDRLPDGPELTTGLRKLLEAKDCFVRAMLPTAPVTAPSAEPLGGRAAPVDPAKGWPE